MNEFSYGERVGRLPKKQVKLCSPLFKSCNKALFSPVQELFKFKTADHNFRMFGFQSKIRYQSHFEVV